jgi:hypothetical protein
MKRLAVGLTLVAAVATAALLVAPGASTSTKKLANLAPSQRPVGLQCAVPGKDYLCTDVEAGMSTHNLQGPYKGPYLGHDEPSALFYSHIPGSGNNATFGLTLPSQPPVLPVQDGSGTSWDFQLHPAFWFGMAMCDSTSYPNYTSTCNPNTDSNIYNDPTPSSPNFIAKHPGTAFMEMQFYPPGWAPFINAISCDPTKWCASLNIDSYNVVSATNGFSNFSCSAAIGTLEPAQFAYLTKGTSGLGANGPANPWDATLGTYTPDPSNNLFMNGGDKLSVAMNDTPAGFKVTVHDLTSGQAGAMVAGPANGFAHPAVGNGNQCDVPYAFHPMYSTSSEATRVVWAAHSYNVAYSDEIGHFQLCTPVAAAGFPGYAPCTGNENGDGGGLPEAHDGDDGGCLNGAAWSLLVQVDGCIGSNTGFDGSSYIARDWPGNGNDANTPTPIRFSSPYANGSKFQQYDRVGFETDLIALENSAPPYGGAPFSCSTHTAGPNCSNPPVTDDSTVPLVEQAFYPMFTTAHTTGPVGSCVYQEGGPGFGTVLNDFGGSSTTEYGPPYKVIYPQDGSGNTNIITRYENYHQSYTNPCKNPGN